MLRIEMNSFVVKLKQKKEMKTRREALLNDVIFTLKIRETLKKIETKIHINQRNTNQKRNIFTKHFQ